MSIRLSVLSLLALAGCGPVQQANETRVVEPSPSPTSVPTAIASAPAAGMRSCRIEIGATAAARKVEVCRNVSPATHPPCNAANSCAMIDDEIARSCALFDGRGAPMKGCTTDPKGPVAAADVVRRYYAAIDARDYATAWQQWGDDGRPGQTLASFQAGFTRTRSTGVTIGALPPAEGAAGSTYQKVPVTVSATLTDGTRQRFVGSYVVRRVNDVDGASAGQRRWHLASATLKPAS
jgi:hypothetical protein